MKKILFIVLDGLGDRPVAELGDRTPLEAADLPHLNRLAASGQQGTVITVGKDIAPESDVAVMAILGYDPLRFHAGRGPLEALGAGLPFQDGDLALRGNFATLGAGWTILDRRVGRNLQSQEAVELAEAVEREVRLSASGADVVVRATSGHRCVVVMHPEEGRLSAKISNTDPAYARVGGLGVAKADAGNKVDECRPLDDSPEAWTAAELVNEFTRKSREVLDGHPVNRRRRERGDLPANVILLRDAGDHLPQTPSMQQRFGVQFGCFVEMPVERGIARLLGMTIIEVPPSADDRERVYRLWARRAIEELPRHGGLYLHLKGPDEPGHDGEFLAKRAVLSVNGVRRFVTSTVMAGAEHGMLVRMRSFAPFVATLLVCLIFVPALAQSPEVFPGVDGVELAIDSLTGRRIGVVTHQAAVSRDGRLTMLVLTSLPDVQLSALFAPEHGLGDDAPVAPPAGTPVYSLFGRVTQPTQQMLSRVDVLVIDLQDVGVRPFTYATTMALTMEAARSAGKPVIVLDRPNPMGGLLVDGPVLELQFRSFIGMYL